MTLYVQHNGKVVAVPEQDIHEQTLYYKGSYVPPSIVYVTRIEGDNIFWVYVYDNSRFPEKNAHEHKDNKQMFCAGVFPATQHMQNKLKKLYFEKKLSKTAQELIEIEIFEITAVLTNDLTQFNIPVYETYAEYQTRITKEQQERAEYDKTVTKLYVKDTAKLVRTELKQHFPGIKFSVRSNSYTGYSSIDIGWVDGPTKSEVQKIVNIFQCKDHDPIVGGYSGNHDTMYNGKLHRFYVDSVMCERNFTEPSIKIMLDKLCKKWGVNPQDFEIITNSSGAQIKRDYGHEIVKRAGDDMTTLIWRESQDTSFYTKPEETQHDVSPDNGVAYSEYKGNPIISLPLDNGKDFNFGVQKAKAILAYLAEIEQFVKDNK